MSVADWLHRQRRRLFGRHVVLDPRAVAEDAPYTYFLPSENELLALAPGDLAKITIRSVPPSRAWDAERMWVEIVEASGEELIGRLDNEPSDMPQLHHGARITFRRSDVIDLIWNDDRTVPPPPPSPRRDYWDRCLVDDCVLSGEASVHYLYREEPEDAQEDDSYADSGWRIRGDYRDVPDEELDAREVHYVALGAVLNHDDSWLDLIDAPVGSAFLRNWQTGSFERAE